jgi:hypothetical protein
MLSICLSDVVFISIMKKGLLVVAFGFFFWAFFSLKRLQDILLYSERKEERKEIER